MQSLLDHPVLGHLLTVGGVVLALFAIARIISERRQPSNTLAWLLAIILIPYVGVPFYLLLGGRKLRRLLARKSPFSAGRTELPPARAAVSPTAQAATGSGACPPTGGNQVRLLATGEEAFKELERQILAARHSIHITTFILGRDETGKRVVRLLAERARAGVKVRLLLDAVGCVFSSRGFVEPIRAAGGEARRFMPVLPFFSLRNSANLRNHRKIAIFDGQHAIIGGHNLAREYMGPTPIRKRWRDFGAVVAGPAASLLNDVFLADWSFASGQPLEELRRSLPSESAVPAGNSELQVVPSGPDVPGDALYEAIVSMIQEAERSIWIVTPYFIPDEVLLRSLIVKARAGREVVLVVPARSNHPITDFARRHYVRELQRAGGRVLLFGPGMMHSKGVIVDDRIGLIGSANFDLRSLFVNFEIGLLLYSEPDIRAMRAWAEELMEHSRRPKAERPSRYRIVGNLVEELSRLLAPLL
ncbi:MAG TPA: phospholipase D-like domain-containing protein [Opitutaceae bacterium]|nr:phospholipase D-like domain-containing protein [Opitutaceae bacterium]